MDPDPEEPHERLWPPNRKTTAPPVHATLHVEPATARPGEKIGIWVDPVGDLDVVRGKFVWMRPVEGTVDAKDSQSYVMIGARPGQQRIKRTHFGPGEGVAMRGPGYPGSQRLEFIVPAAAVPQRYRLAVNIGVREPDSDQNVSETVETILSVV